MKKLIKQGATVAFITLMLITALNVAGSFVEPIAVRAAGTYEKLKIFADALSTVERNYVEEVDTQDLIYNAINGMLTSLDPHSSFLTPDDFREMQVETKGSFGGVGIEITMRSGVLTVVSPIEDTPAFKAGIQSEDIIIKIDGEFTKDMKITEAVKRMRGKKGTKVILTVVRNGEPEPIDFTIIRDIIKIKSVKHEVLEEHYGYARITQFQERTLAEMKKALNKLKKETGGIKGLILDLRNNPGGLLDQAVKISDLFLSSGLIVYTDGRLENQKMKFHAVESGTEPDYPLVVLVNAGSASASEIVAGAIQDTGRGIILGTKTFGKGSVQTILPLEDGSGIRLTTARYYTPNGRSIQAEGIVPDIEVEAAVSEKTKRYPVIREKDLKGHIPNGNGKKPKEETGIREEEPDMEAVKPEDIREDVQVKTALDILKSWDIFKKSLEKTT